MRTLAIVIAALALFAPPAGAQSVANPGPVTLTSTGGNVAIGPYSAAPAFVPPDSFSWAGSIGADGTIVIPESELSWPEIDLPQVNGLMGVDQDEGTARLEPTGDATGHLDPRTGVTTLELPTRVRITASGNYPSAWAFFLEDDWSVVCVIDGASPAFTMHLTTGATSPPAGVEPVTGVPYDAGVGTLTLVDNSIAPVALESDHCNWDGGTAVDVFQDDLFDAMSPFWAFAPTESIRIEARLDPTIKGPALITPAPPPGQAPGPITGTAGNDILTGTPGNDVFYALGGNDTIRGLGGNDAIYGGAGNDRLVAGGGRDRLVGGAGRDTLLARGGGKDTLNGGKGRDRGSWNRGDRVNSVERRLA